MTEHHATKHPFARGGTRETPGVAPVLPEHRNKNIKSITRAHARPEATAEPTRGHHRSGYPLLVAAPHVEPLLERLERLEDRPTDTRADTMADRARRGELATSTQPRAVRAERLEPFRAPNGRDYAAAWSPASEDAARRGLVRR